MPPVAVTVSEYGVPLVPSGTDNVVMSTAVATAMDSACVSVRPAESVTVMEKLDVPAAVGVPEIAPFDATVSPAGREPLVTAKEYGPVPPVAVTVWEYAVPVVPSVSDGVVMSGGSPHTACKATPPAGMVTESPGS